MLRQRVLTAVGLLALLAGVLFWLPHRFFVVAVSLLLVVAAWEWARLAGWEAIGQRVAYASAHALAYGAAACWLPLEAPGITVFLAVTSLGWLLALRAVTGYPQHTGWMQPGILACVGCWLLFPVWVSLLVLKNHGGRGELIALAIAVIAVADSGAYFAGRRFGGAKLAIQVSPGKTWAGFWGGLLSSLLLALAVGVGLGWPFRDVIIVVVALVLVAAASVLGDLFESMVKRARGIKDSGNILPGHGGILDRIDGWTAAMPLFTLFYLLWDPR